MATALLERCLDGPELLQTLAIDVLLGGTVARHLGAGPTAAQEACHG